MVYLRDLIFVFIFRVVNKPKSEMSAEELRKQEEEEFATGPFSVLTEAVKTNIQVLSNIFK